MATFFPIESGYNGKPFFQQSCDGFGMVQRFEFISCLHSGYFHSSVLSSRCFAFKATITFLISPSISTKTDRHIRPCALDDPPKRRRICIALQMKALKVWPQPLGVWIHIRRLVGEGSGIFNVRYQIQMLRSRKRPIEKFVITSMFFVSFIIPYI